MPKKEPFKHEMSNYGAHEKTEAKEMVSPRSRAKNAGLVSMWYKRYQ